MKLGNAFELVMLSGQTVAFLVVTGLTFKLQKICLLLLWMQTNGHWLIRAIVEQDILSPHPNAINSKLQSLLGVKRILFQIPHLVVVTITLYSIVFICRKRRLAVDKNKMNSDANRLCTTIMRTGEYIYGIVDN